MTLGEAMARFRAGHTLTRRGLADTLRWSNGQFTLVVTGRRYMLTPDDFNAYDWEVVT